ncbi:MAG: hypothetical protein IJ358_03540, partial [Clostridia bacterium]|nr:hypothetical protein [Clostridia bacterium]
TDNNPIASTNYGKIEYTYSTYDEGINIIEKPSDAGTYYVIATVEGKNNYEGVREIKKFIIAQDTPDITLPNYGTIYVNYHNLEQDFTPVAKNLKGEQISGQWEYTTLNYVHGDNASSFTLTFVPTDSANYESVSKPVNVTVKSVAKIGTVYYETIEQALADAESGNTVFVLPDATGKVVIANHTTIGTGVTMVMLFAEDETSGRNSSGVATLNTSNAASCDGITSLKCTNQVVLNEGIKITIESGGVLEIAGELSSSGGAKDYAGHTARNYAELLMQKDSLIDCYGEIKCTGFINESVLNNGSQVTINDGSISLPFVLRDFKGGSYMYAVYNKISSKATSAFNQYQFRNISSKLRVNYSGEVYGYANLYASDKNNNTIIKFVGTTSDFLIQFTEKDFSYLEAKYDPRQNYEVCDLDIYGGMTLNSMSLSINVVLFTADIDTANVYFPLNWAFDISLNKSANQESAYFNLKQKIKMMPGSKLTIEKGVTAEFSSLNIYGTYTDQNTKPSAPLYPSKDPALLTVNGKMICDTVGGNIYSSIDNAQVVINTSVSITTNETKGEVKGSGFFASISTFQTITNTATFCGTGDPLTATSTGTYVYTNGKWALSA